MREALQGALQLLGGFLLDGQLRQRLQEEQLVQRLLGALLGLARLQGAAAVREAALQVLTAAMELPYHLLHPHRQQVSGSASGRCSCGAVGPARRLRNPHARALGSAVAGTGCGASLCSPAISSRRPSRRSSRCWARRWTTTGAWCGKQRSGAGRCGA